MKYLRNLLPSQANLGNVLPLLGMLFKIPINILPLPSLFYNDESCIQNEEKKIRKRGEGSGALEEFIDLKECSGPDLSDVNMKEYTLPLLEIIFECLCSSKAISLKRNTVIDCHHKHNNNNNSTSYDTSNNISNNDDDRNDNDNDNDTGNQTENIDSNNANDQIHKEYVEYEKMKYVLRDTILKTLSHGFFTLSSFRLLMQRKRALQNLLTSLLFYHDSAEISNDKLVHFNHPLSGSNLPGELNENHFSLRITSSPSIDKNMNNSNHNNNNNNDNNDNNNNNNMSSNGSNNNLSSLPSSNFANRKFERSKSLQKSDEEIYDIGNDSDRNLAASSPSNPANSLFKGSPNWENLFESTPEKLTSNSTMIQNQNYNQENESTNLIATEKEILGKCSLDEGKKLLTLISSIIFSGIIELENPSMIAALFLCLPSDDVNHEKHQLLIIDCFQNVVTDIFTDYYDSSTTKKSQKVLLILSGVLNHLINLLKLNFFALSVKFELLQLTLKILEVSYQYKVIDKNRSFLKDKEKEKERITALSISKDLGETGRCFACSCFETVEDAEMKKFKKRNECLQGSNCSILLFFIILIFIILFFIVIVLHYFVFHY